MLSIIGIILGILLILSIGIEYIFWKYHNKHLTNYQPKTTNYKFSFGTALMGACYPLFQWKYMYRKKISFIKELTPGSKLFVWLVLINIPFTILFKLVNPILGFIIILFEFFVFGKIGAKWKNENLAVTDENEASVNKREKIASIIGILMIILFSLLSFSSIDTSNKTVSNSYDEQNKYFVENGYICDKYLNFASTFSDNDGLRKEMLKIHTYCPSDVIWTERVNHNVLIHTFPQLTDYDFEKLDFIYQYKQNNYLSYIYIKRLY